MADSADPQSAGTTDPTDAPNPARLERLKIACALTIAVISVLGAVVAWRASAAGSRSGDAERDGLVAAASEAGRHTAADATARRDELAYRRWARHRAAAQAKLDQLEALPPGSAVAETVRHDAEVELKLTQAFRQYLEADYQQAHGTYDLAKRTQDELAAAQQKAADPTDLFDEADDQESQQHRLIGIELLLILSLALVTMAQVAEGERRTLAWALPGWLGSLAGCVLFVAVAL